MYRCDRSSRKNMRFWLSIRRLMEKSWIQKKCSWNDMKKTLKANRIILAQGNGLFHYKDNQTQFEQTDMEHLSGTYCCHQNCPSFWCCSYWNAWPKPWPHQSRHYLLPHARKGQSQKQKFNNSTNASGYSHNTNQILEASFLLIYDPDYITNSSLQSWQHYNLLHHWTLSSCLKKCLSFEFLGAY